MDINLTNPVTTAKIGEVVNGASAATPNDTDLLPVIESSVTKKLTLTNLKAFLKTYFDTLYSNLGYTAENVANKSSSYTLSSTTTYANTKALVDGLATKEPLKGSDDNYVTDAQLVVIQNTSGTNSGDNATNSTSNTYADGKVADSITNGVTTIAPSQNAVFDALALKATIAQLPYDISYYKKTGAATFKQYYTQAITQIALVTGANGGNVGRYIPLIVSKTTTLAEIGVEVTGAGSAGSVARLCIYSSSNQLPDQLILNAGTIAANSATPQLITGISTVLNPGLYFLYFNTNSTTNVTLRCLPVSAIPNICGATSAMGANSISYLFVAQTYTDTPPTTALAPTNQTIATPIAFFMYFSS